ncbi:MAG: FAD:protein FMN transferase, partial [Clostridia bacterium]|nr:FAD:protein FMN transferase [Clostridia bacterium]
YAVIDGVRYCHIIDPRTGRPVDNGVHSVVVWNHDGLEGDVISTALFVLGEDGIETLKDAGLDFEALIISERGMTMTDGMKEIITVYE